MNAYFFASALLVSAVGYSADLIPADNLIVDGIPPIPRQIATEARPYSESRSANFLSFHPQKPEMLIQTRFAESPQIHYLRSPNGARKQMTFFSDRVLSASFEPKAGSYFVFSKDENGGEWFQNYRFDMDTGKITLLTDGASRNTRGIWSHSQDRMAYGSTRRNGKDMDFYVVDPKNPQTTKMVVQLDKGEAWSILDWSLDDSKLLAMETISINESHLWIFDMATQERVLVTKKSDVQQVAYKKAKFVSGINEILALTDKDSEFLHLSTINIATGEHSKLQDWAFEFDIEDFEVNPDGKLIAYTVNMEGVSVLYIFNRETKKYDTIELPMGVVSGLDWHPSLPLLGFSISSAQIPGDVFTFNIETRDLVRWTESETGGLDATTFVKPQLFDWRSFDELRPSGFLYTPPKAKFPGKRPVMVIIHGGPESQSRPGYLGSYNYYLNELGIALVFPNIRGSSGYGKTFLKLDNGFLRENSYKDLEALLDYIKKHDDFDGDRIMVTGGSYGGHATLAVATRNNDKIACSLDVVGMSNLRTFLERTEEYRRDLRRAEYGDERDSAMREFLERIAPLNHAHKITKPLFIVQGMNDPRVPASEAIQMMDAVKRNGTPAWYLAAKDEGHGFAKKSNRDFQFFSTIMFVRKYLLGLEQ